MLKISLRTKFLLALAAISASLTWATLFVVRQRVTVQVRGEIARGLETSVVTFRSMQRHRDETLQQSAALLASLPPLKAVMTSRDTATIQDASAMFWQLSGSELFVLADGAGRVMALHTSNPGFEPAGAQESLTRSVASGKPQAWWYGNGRLYQVFLKPIYFGSADDQVPMGLLAVGYEIDNRVAEDISRVSASRVAVRYGNRLVVSTVSSQQGSQLAQALADPQSARDKPEEIELGHERFLVTSVTLSSDSPNPVTLTVLRSFDEATAFLASLNPWILGAGLIAVLAGGILVFLVSTTFTRPLEELLEGVRALEKGDYTFPLHARGGDEVSALTAAFQRMRLQLLETQGQLLDAERLATIGRMASMISHDLRHPLTAILAYAEFLSNGNLTEFQRKDFFEEIRIAVNRMTDEISSLLGFSSKREAIHPEFARLDEIVQHAIENVKILPEFQTIAFTYSDPDECSGWFDTGKVERVLMNLLFNACEAVCPVEGKIAITSRETKRGVEIRVTDNGPGIPESIRDSIFQPFVSHGKEKGIGLGLTVVRKIMHDHGGEISILNTGPEGTVFELVFPKVERNEPEAQAPKTPTVPGASR